MLADDCAQELVELAVAGRLRERPRFDGGNGRCLSLKEQGRRLKLINWASNDYLGALGEITVRNGAARALRQFGSGSGSARLLSGGLAIHRRLEQRLANWHGLEDCLCCTSGYQCNLAVLTSLADSADDCIIVDRLCHASTYDGIRLAAGRMQRFKHNDCADLAHKLEQAQGARRILVCVESIYSMDGDLAPLAEIAALCDRHKAALIVDEAHAIGVVGPGGRGLCAQERVVPSALIGTCGKSLGGQGGYVAAARPVVEWIVNRGRSFIFSTAPVPAAPGAVLAMLELLKRRSAMPELLRKESAELRQGLRAIGWDVPEGISPIIPVLVGSEERALALAAALRVRGHYAPAIRPPTVPEGGCRLRLTNTLAHRPSDRRKLIEAMRELFG
jgi:8-amino-7-oxononanoate synthase